MERTQYNEIVVVPTIILTVGVFGLQSSIN